eukprot:892229-Rhodomonas_salina.1
MGRWPDRWCMRRAMSLSPRSLRAKTAYCNNAGHRPVGTISLIRPCPKLRFRLEPELGGLGTERWGVRASSEVVLKPRACWMPRKNKAVSCRRRWRCCRLPTNERNDQKTTRWKGETDEKMRKMPRWEQGTA